MDTIIFVTFCGFILDLLLGDPYHFPHPVRAIGYLITKGEDFIRKLLGKTKKQQRLGGVLLVLLVVCVTVGCVLLILKVAYSIHYVVGLMVEVVLCYQALATKSLKDESMKVYDALKKHDLEGARYAVSMIVGRDTKTLTEEGIAKATIETIAENTSDGIIGPLFYLLIGGVPLGYAYKAINTLDSMIGYQNERYQYFGTFGAKLDDVVNYIPARLSAYIMMMASFICRFDCKRAYRVYKRDRYNHKSPNSAHTEAVCAGALGIQLAGDAYYFGKLVAKPTIGDVVRTVETEDIKQTNKLMYVTCILSLILLSIIRLIILIVL